MKGTCLQVSLVCSAVGVEVAGDVCQEIIRIIRLDVITLLKKVAAKPVTKSTLDISVVSNVIVSPTL